MGETLTADVAVVGGGLVGAALAYELRVAGCDVVLVDAALAGRASDAGAGILSPETFQEPDPHWYEFGAAAAGHAAALVDRLADEGTTLGADAYARCGSLVVALAEHEDPWFSSAFALAQARDPDVTELTGDEARGLFPPLGPVWRAFHSPAGTRVDGRALSAALRAAAARRGARIVAAEVTGVEGRLGRVDALRASDLVVRCGTVVAAAGAWSAGLAASMGAVLRVTPTKGQIVHMALPSVRGDPGGDAALGDTDSGRWPVVQPVLNFYLVPWPAGRVACGGTFEPDAAFDVRATASGLRDLLRECVAIAPGLAQATFLEVRVGLRPTSPDGRPVIGPLPGLANVHVCTGHGANGLLLGPYSAALVAATIAGTEPPGVGGELGRDILRRCSPGRFGT